MESSTNNIHDHSVVNQPHNYLALMCEGMDWELNIEEELRNSPSAYQESCQYWESMEGPNTNITNDATNPIATSNSNNNTNIALPLLHDFPEIVPLDLLKLGMINSECNSSTNSVSNSCLNFNSLQKSFHTHIDSPFLSLASNDYATHNDHAGILLSKSQANLADDCAADEIADCNRAGADQEGGYDRVKCIAKSSDDADAGCDRVKSSEVFAEVAAKQGTSEDDDHSNSELSRKDVCHGMQDLEENQSNSEDSCKELEGSRRKKSTEASSIMYKCKTSREGQYSDQNEASELDFIRKATSESEPPHAHIFTERERRKKMKCLYDTLQSLLSLSKADKATILEATISKIQMLENEKTLLLSQKAAKCRKLPKDNDELHGENNNKKEVHQNFLQSNESTHDATLADQENFDHNIFDMKDPFGHVELHVSGSMGLFTISLQKAISSSLHLPNVILTLLLNNNLEVLSAHISSSHDIIHFSLYTKASKGSPNKRDSFQLAYRELLCKLPT